MSSFNPVNLLPNKDHDALFVLMVSVIVVVISCGLFFLFFTFFVIRKALETAAVPSSSDTVYLVFGKKLANGKPDSEYRCRLDRLLSCDFRNAILMGGKTAGAKISEAQAGYEYLLEQNVLLNNIRLEDHSRNTLENLKNARQLLNRQNTVIISNRYHLARCSILASSLGIRHQLCAAEDKFRLNGKNLVNCLQEAFYLHWFYSGKYWAMLTRNQRMLNKIS